MSTCAKFRRAIDAQKQHWNKMYAEEPDFFGEEPSYAAKKAAEVFEKEGKLSILELGAGQGRDSLFFAKSGFKVQAIDYSENAVQAINQKANSVGLSDSISAVQQISENLFHLLTSLLTPAIAICFIAWLFA